MAIQNRNREPDSFVAGDTISWVRCLAAFPANAVPAWSLTYELIGGPQPISFTSTPDADGTSHDIYVAPATTATWAPGDYELYGYAGNGIDRQLIYRGDCPIWQNQEAAKAGQDTRTLAQKMLANIEAAMVASSGNPLLITRIGDAEFRFRTTEDWMLFYKYWVDRRKNEIDEERAQSGKPSRNKIQSASQRAAGSRGCR